MTLLEIFAEALNYPEDRTPQARLELQRVAENNPTDYSVHLKKYLNGTSDLSISSFCELYTRTFDLMAVCSPYVGIHLYGEDNYKRGGLMAKLKEAFSVKGFDAGNELPDHLPVLLRYCTVAPEEEADEIREYLLIQTVEKMVAILEKTQNPYTHLLQALQSVLTTNDPSTLREQILMEKA